MKQNQVAKRYALAVYEIAKENNSIEETAEQLKLVEEVVNNTNLVDTFFENRKVSRAQKKEVIQTSFQGKISDTLLNTLFLLIDKNREGILFNLVEEFTKLKNIEQGIDEAHVYTAQALTDAEKQAFEATFLKASGKETLTIVNIVDASIIGGFKVRIGDRIYDGSVSNQLKRIQRRMTEGNVSR